jgi:3-hydroxymyristoyl/3-hydroxydecanoyl-(acyl carrier protein) dehydratase
VPLGVHFPASLMAEAVGQLAAWAGMAQLGFEHRPVAGLANTVNYHQLPQPGSTLQLQADIERCDAEAVAYSGKVFIDGRLALELVDSVGPMLPMEEFDSPEAVRADFHTLLGAGAAPGRFGGVPLPELHDPQVTPGERLGATLQVPEFADTPYFTDHFPRRPVFPGTLLMDALASLSVQLAQQSGPLAGTSDLVTRKVTQVKIRSFTAPGARLQLEVVLQDADAQRARLKATARSEDKTIATARIEITPRSAP